MGKKRHLEFLFEKLETRLLLNADPAMLGVASGQAGAAIDVAMEVSAQPDSGAHPDAMVSEQLRQEVIFVDGGVDDYQQLIADLRSQADDRTRQTVVLLDPGRDGIAQISVFLNQNQDIDAVHIFSHGSDGTITLGSTWLSADTLDEHAADIASWQQALSGEADLLFYGCNLASGRDGQALIDTISSLTGADVAASEDLTGNTRLGGDWQLEYTKGEIETRAAINSESQPQWSGVLATFTVNTTSDTVDATPGDGFALDGSGNTSLRSAIMEANALGGEDTILLGAGTYSLTLGSSSEAFAKEGDLDIRTKVTITGVDAATTIIDGNDLDRVFHLNVDAADLTLNNLTVQGGSAGRGGGIRVGANLATFTASQVNITGNVAQYEGAGIYNSGTVSLTDVEISNNGDVTTDDGGGIYNEEEATLNRVTISGNHADKEGGGLYTKGPITILNSTFSSNSAEDGGGIFNESDGAGLFMENTTISGNTADKKGGGLFTIEPITILNSTFSSNSAEDGGGIFNDSSGAGLFMENTTISGNTADKKGGGLFTKDGISILNNTITLNDANDGGGIHIESNTISLKNTIVAGNTAASNPDIRGTFTSQGDNLIQNTTGGNGFVGSDITGVSADLDPLADNGGFTQTHALQASSQAINKMGLSGAPALDQRGIVRDATPDIGAYEYTNTNNAPTITSTAVTTATEDTAYSYTFTVNDTDVGDTLTLSAPTLPAWLSFNPVTGVLSGTPDNTEVGDHDVVLRVSDGTVTEDQSFTVTVSNTNDAPTITSTAVMAATEDSAYSYTLTATDPDIGDTLTLGAPTLPVWLSFNPSTGVLSGTPTNAQVGDHSVVLRVSDGTVNVNQSFTITVSNTNDAPTITSTAITAVAEDTAYSYTFTATDPDIGNTLTLSAPTLPAWLSFNPVTGVLSGTPTNAQVGDHNVVLRVSDSTVTEEQSFTITVSNTNDSPTITSTAFTGAVQNIPYSYTFTATDPDIGDTLILSSPTLPAWLSFNPVTGVLSGTPTNAQVGDHNVVLRVSDGTVTDDQSFTITVNNTNDAPTITSTAATVATEDSAYSYTFTVTDPDSDDTLTLSAPTLPLWLSFDPVTGVLSGTPTNAEVGDHNVVLRVSDGTVTDDQSFTITVNNTNDAPTITSTAITIATEDTAYSYSFTVNDMDAGDTLTLSAPTLPPWLSFDPTTGVLSGTPTEAEIGDHNVILRVSDSTVTDEQLFTITVNNINDAPAITSSAITAATEDTTYSYTFTATDPDSDDTLTLIAPTLPPWLSFDPSTGVLSGTPTNAEVGDHDVVLGVSDGTVTDEQRFAITVSNTNDTPIITSTAFTGAVKDMPYSYTFTANDPDIGDTLTLSASTLPAWLSFNPSTGVLSGTPTNAQVGDHTVVLRVSDGIVTDEQRFTITVRNTNTAPTITSTAITAATEGTAYSYTITATDPDIGDTLNMSAPTLPTWLSFNPVTGVLSGTPADAEVGNHNVVLRVSDGTITDEQRFTITVSNTNQAPIITSTAITTANEDAAYSYSFSVNDVDAGDTLTLSAPTLPAWLSFNPVTGLLAGTPTDAEVGNHNVVLRVSDGTVTNDQSFTITVIKANQIPVITSTAVTAATEDTAYSYSFSVNDMDAGDTLTLSAPTLPAWLSFNPVTGMLSGTPTNTEVGNHNVVLRVNDGTVNLDQRFTITVSNINDAPIALDDTLTVNEDNSMTIISAINLLGNDTDIEGDPLTLSDFAQPDNGTLTDNGDGTLSYTPHDDFSGTDRFTYAISDNNGGTAAGTVTIHVIPVGDTPQVTNASAPAGQASELIFIRPNINDGPEVVYFKISDITNGTLYLADGITPIDDGEFITVSQGEAGLRFVPGTGSGRDGSFHAEASENGVTVATQSGPAVSNITVRPPDSSDPSTRVSEVDSGQQETDTPITEIAEAETVAVTLETVDAPEESTDTTASQNSRRTSSDEESTRSEGDTTLNNATMDAVETTIGQMDEAGIGEESRDRLIALAAKTRTAMLTTQQSRLLGMNQNTTGLGPLAEDNYEYVRRALDALDDEIGNEIQLGRTLLGSAMATSVGLSAGYVIWMLKGGSLLASVLASVPVWQIADPLAILAGSRRDDDEDDESLENIIDDAPDQQDGNKGKASDDETKTADEKL